MTDGYLLERVAETDHPGELAPAGQGRQPRAGAEPGGGDARPAGRRPGAGTLSDVLRLAIPPRHARAEKTAPTVEAQPAPEPPPAPEPDSWTRYPDGPSYLTALADGRSPRAVWSALPGGTWADELATAVQATLAGGRGALVVVPDAREPTAWRPRSGPRSARRRSCVLTADLGPAERYRRFLAAVPRTGPGRRRDPSGCVRARAGPRPGRRLGRR